MKTVKIGGLSVSNDSPLLVIAGPCQLESLDHAQMIAGTMAEACAKAGAQYIFKASYDKANRTSLKGKRGLGIDAGLKVLEAVRAMGIPVLTDIHDAEQARMAAQVVDVIQIPAFLCRQTDLLLAAGETGALAKLADPNQQVFGSLDARFLLGGQGRRAGGGVVFGNQNLKIGAPVELEGSDFRVTGTVTGLKVGA